MTKYAHEIDVSFLHEGEIFNTYKDLCARLNEPVLSSDSKNSQLETWKLYFEFSRDKRRFIITKIYDKKKIKRAKPRLKPSKYADLIYPIILKLYYEHNRHNYGGKAFFIDRMELWQDIGFVNCGFVTAIESPSVILQEFLYGHWSTVDSYCKRALENLNKRNKIKFTEKWKAIRGKRSVCLRQATVEKIKILEQDLLKKFDCKSTFIIRRKGLIGEYYEQFNYLLKENLNLRYLQKVYRITLPTKSKITLLNNKNKSSDFTTSIYANAEKCKQELNNKIFLLLQNENNRLTNNYATKLSETKNQSLWQMNRLTDIAIELRKRGKFPPFHPHSALVDAYRRQMEQFLNEYILIESNELQSPPDKVSKLSEATNLLPKREIETKVTHKKTNYTRQKQIAFLINKALNDTDSFLNMDELMFSDSKKPFYDLFYISQYAADELDMFIFFKAHDYLRAVKAFKDALEQIYLGRYYSPVSNDYLQENDIMEIHVGLTYDYNDSAYNHCFPSFTLYFRKNTVTNHFEILQTLTYDSERLNELTREMTDDDDDIIEF